MKWCKNFQASEHGLVEDNESNVTWEAIVGDLKGRVFTFIFILRYTKLTLLAKLINLNLYMYKRKKEKEIVT